MRQSLLLFLALSLLAGATQWPQLPAIDRTGSERDLWVCSSVAGGQPAGRPDYSTSTQTPSATFGLIRDVGSTLGTAYAMRQIQVALKYIF